MGFNLGSRWGQLGVSLGSTCTALPGELHAFDLDGGDGEGEDAPEGHGHLLEVVDGGAGHQGRTLDHLAAQHKHHLWLEHAHLSA